MRTITNTILLLIILASPTLAVETSRQLVRNQGAQASTLRTALVIGNGAYREGPLKNPANDAEAMAAALRASGFEVVVETNASQRQMKEAISAFGKRLARGGAGLFYYAGHGIQVNGTNYLVPVDAKIEAESDVEFEAVDAGRVLTKMEEAGNGLNIVILDACRNNPFARSFRSQSLGLAKMDAPKGSIIAYATAPGSVAADGEGGNGIYTKHLVAAMRQKGEKIEEVLKQVRNEVADETGERQMPWESSSLRGDFYFVPGEGEPPLTPPPITPLATKGWTDPTTGMEFAWVEGGCFAMGSPETEKDRSSDEGQHEVCVSGLWVGKYEVTQGEWEKVMGANPSTYKKGDRYPVESVSWDDAQSYISKLSSRSGKQYRLPTEAEWEHAARGGSTGSRYWGDNADQSCGYANVFDQEEKRQHPDGGWAKHNCDDGYAETAPAGHYHPNGYGLYDMLGNVWEWCSDWYDDKYYATSPRNDPQGPTSGSGRVFRGSSWLGSPAGVRAAGRRVGEPAGRVYCVGFRLVLPPGQ